MPPVTIYQRQIARIINSKYSLLMFIPVFAMKIIKIPESERDLSECIDTNALT